MTLNQKSYVGVDNLYYALVTQDDSSGYVAGTPAYLAPAMNISVKPKTNSKVQYADNQPFDSLSSEGESEADVEITGLPTDIQATLLGKVFDAVAGQYYDNGGTPPYVAVGYRAKKSGGGYKYYWYLKCQFSPFDEETATETDTPDPKSTKLKLRALRTVKTFQLSASVTDTVKRVVGDDSTAAFTLSATWFNSVRVPVYVAPSAITCTPSPVDGATGVAVSVAPTLTFNNQLVTGTTGITLTKNDGAIVTCTITINAALKVITITPGSNLTAAAKYLITVAGARDIYGQTLATAVYDFTCA